MRQPRFFFRIIHFVIEAGLRCGDCGGGGQHGSTPRVISVPTQKGQQVRTQVCAPSHLLPCWLRSGVEPSQVAGGSERNCLDGSADDVAGGGGVFVGWKRGRFQRNN